jgi:hypothetical protein
VHVLPLSGTTSHCRCDQPIHCLFSGNALKLTFSAWLIRHSDVALKESNVAEFGYVLDLRLFDYGLASATELGYAEDIGAIEVFDD